jgi:uncharacterized RDD family membrane protein YckC
VRDPTSVVWRRCFAAATEVVFTILVLVATIFVAGDVRSLKHGCPDSIPRGNACFHYRSSTYLMRESVFYWFALTLTVLVVVVFVLPYLRFGCSLGKAIFRIRVVSPDGASPGFRRSLIRTVALVVDGFTVGLPTGLWLVMFTTGHRRVGDFLARTYVVRRSAVGRPVQVPVRRWGRFHRD